MVSSAVRPPKMCLNGQMAEFIRNKSFFDIVLFLFFFTFFLVLRLTDDVSVLIDVLSRNHLLQILVLVIVAGVLVSVSHIVHEDVMDFSEHILPLLAEIDADRETIPPQLYISPWRRGADGLDYFWCVLFLFNFLIPHEDEQVVTVDAHAVSVGERAVDGEPLIFSLFLQESEPIGTHLQDIAEDSHGRIVD